MENLLEPEFETLVNDDEKHLIVVQGFALEFLQGKEFPQLEIAAVIAVLQLHRGWVLGFIVHPGRINALSPK